MIRIVADDKIPFLKGALDGVADVRYLPGSLISKDDLKDVQAVVTRTRTICNRELLDGTSVEYISSATIGFDHIDTDYCEQAGIRWTNAPGCNSSSVQQYVVSALLHLAAVKKEPLKGKTIGIIGVGNVGSLVATAAAALGMKVLLNDPPRERREKDTGSGPGFISLGELLSRSDVVTIHTPLNRGGQDNTFEMVNDRFISLMKKEAILINTSRGEVMDEGALIPGIYNGRFSAVVLDVFRNEPGIDRALLDAITLGTPHIAGYSIDGKARGTSMAVRALSRYFNLGMDKWEPGSLPGPETGEILADCTDSGPLDVIRQVYHKTYHVATDDNALRKDPESFEKLRGDYPLRREPVAYSVRLFQGSEEVKGPLEALGFSVLSDRCF